MFIFIFTYFLGIYFADVVTKSANYCSRHGCHLDDEEIDDTIFVLVCDVALGSVLECFGTIDIETLHSGKDSIKACGETVPNSNDSILDGVRYSPGPLHKAVEATLEHNEYIIRDVSRVKIKYLLEMTMKKK